MSDSEMEASASSYEGARIRELRKAKGLSMKRLAALMDGDVHFTTIAKIETGKMRLSTEWLRRIAAALEVTPLEIVWDKFSGDNARVVPLYASRPWPPERDASGNWIPLGRSSTMIGGELSFAIALGGPPDNYSNDPLYQVVVDPSLDVLKDGEPYAFASRETARLGIYRDSPPRFEQWLADRPGVMLVGAEPFELLGRLVWLNRDMFS